MSDITKEEMQRLLIPLRELPGMEDRGLQFTNQVIGRWNTPSYDLADASTRDRLARWVAERVGVILGSTAPAFYRANDSDTGCLDLEGRSYILDGAKDAPGHLFEPEDSMSDDPDTGFEDAWDTVPGLSDLDEADCRTLPDGSFYRDALALAVVARHVGGAK